VPKTKKKETLEINKNGGEVTIWGGGLVRGDKEKLAPRVGRVRIGELSASTVGFETSV